MDEPKTVIENFKHLLFINIILSKKVSKDDSEGGVIFDPLGNVEDLIAGATRLHKTLNDLDPTELFLKAEIIVVINEFKKYGYGI